MSDPTAFCAGVARATITPPVGIDMSGFAGREASLGIHDDLFATAIVFREGDDSVALICCDLLFLDADFVRQVREECRKRTSIPAERIGVSCSHTHYGPSTKIDSDDPDVQAYLGLLKYQLVGAVQEAAANVEPVNLGVGWGTCDIGINRRERKPDGAIVLGQNPKGNVDRAVGVVRIDTPDGEPLAVIANFACHCVSQSGQMRRLSSDYPAPARDLVEETTGAMFLFAQGAGANTNPIRMENSFEPARTLGTRFGCEVLRVWETVVPKAAVGLRAALKEVELPSLTFGCLDEAEHAVANLAEQLEKATADNAGKGSLHWLELRLKRATAARDSLQSGQPLPPVASEAQVLRLGDVALCLTPGEVFCEIGMEVREHSPLPHTLFLAYSNGSIGYVPTPESYSEGGYEVSHACRVGPEAAGGIVEACLDALRQCA